MRLLSTTFMSVQIYTDTDLYSGRVGYDTERTVQNWTRYVLKTSCMSVKVQRLALL